MYSQKSVNEGHGTCYYEDANGNLIEVTAVYSSEERAKEHYNRPDTKVVSTTLVRYVKPGIPIHEYNFFRRPTFEFDEKFIKELSEILKGTLKS